MSHSRPGTGIAKVAGILSIIAGIVFVLAGGATWFMVSDQLAAEEITVPEDARFLAGQEVRGPFTAFAQADVISTHALAGTEGRTYAELGAAMQEVEPGTPEHSELQAQRTSVMTASFLRASLFTSVVAYGVAALVVGLGVLLALIGLALMRLASAATDPVPATAHDRRGADRTRHSEYAQR